MTNSIVLPSVSFSDAKRLLKKILTTTIALLSVTLPSGCALMGGSSGHDDGWAAKVGDEVVTIDEFNEAIQALHKSGRVGKGLSEARSFEKQNYGKFLDELIDARFMAIEAKNAKLDKEPDFISEMDNYALNLSLRQLRYDEVTAKVKVEPVEIEAYYREKGVKKKEHGAHSAKPQPEQKDDKESKEPVEIKPMSDKDKEAVRNAIVKEKSVGREKAYFDELRAEADVKTYADALKAASEAKPESMGQVVAEVNGYVVTAGDVIAQIKTAKRPDNEAERVATLDRLILYKLLDNAARRRNYPANDKAIALAIKKHRLEKLQAAFKVKVILPSIVLKDSEVSEYYERNKEKYRLPDALTGAFIMLTDAAKAKETLDDLKKGADFAYLAQANSSDKSGKAGQVITVNANAFSPEAINAFSKAKKGDILGPFEMGGSYVVVNFIGIEPGQYIPIEDARKEITNLVVNEKFKTRLEEYVKRLRASIPVVVNQEILK
ncbi:MAG: peptidyl-prolyl cis-trans isomerase [Deltaproteobacteria bacterium]|nr:peptidyl-prolyl cis-trans isomerase [Deltaproteobacteria bacterium]